MDFLIYKILLMIYNVKSWFCASIRNKIKVSSYYPEDYLPQLTDKILDKFTVFEVEDLNNLSPVEMIADELLETTDNRYIFTVNLPYFRLYWLLGEIWSINLVSDKILSTGFCGIKVMDMDFIRWIPKNYRKTYNVIKGLYDLFRAKSMMKRKPAHLSFSNWTDIIERIYDYLDILCNSYGDCLRERKTLKGLEDDIVIEEWKKDYESLRLRAELGRKYLIEYWEIFTKL